MNKIAIVSDKAGWVLDQIRKDYTRYTSLKVVDPKDKPDLIWPIDFWSLKKAFSYGRPVVGHVHHINTEKEKDYDFSPLKMAVGCITNNLFTLKELQERNVNEKLKRIPYWLLSATMSEKYKKNSNREVFNIGYFQKDSEGNTNLPKLIKGPDIFADVVEKINKKRKINVILSGRSRQYIISELIKRGISYEYHERATNINYLYDQLDCYIVTSRVEGGPQASLEASWRKVPIISTNVGISPDVLHENCICSPDEIPERVMACHDYIMYNYEQVKTKFLPDILIPEYDKFFKELI